MRRRPLAAILIPLVLIAAGVLLLLNTLGVLPWDAWSEIWRFWPILVILFGLTILWKNIRRP